MAVVNLLYRDRVEINDYISVMIPKVRDVLEHEEEYYRLVLALTAMPYDMMVQLDDLGIDFTEIDEYELFLLLFQGLRSEDTSLIFGDLDLSTFDTAANHKNHTVILKNEDGIVIDRAIYSKIADTLRRIHHLEKTLKKPGNEEAKEYLLQRTRKKLARRKNRKTMSELESLITGMVNAAEYKYNYETTLDLSIYQFNQSVHQIMNKVDYDNRMRGVYAGTIDAKRLSEDELSWLPRNK